MTHTTHWCLQPILFIGDVNIALFASWRRRVDWLPLQSPSDSDHHHPLTLQQSEKLTEVSLLR